MKKLLPLLLLPLAVNALEVPEGYESLGSDTTGTEYYIHKDSVRRKGDLAYYWIITNRPEKNTKGLGSWIRSYEVIDCEAMESDELSFTRYNAKGETLEKRKFKNRDWEPIPPGTMADVFYKSVCGKE